MDSLLLCDEKLLLSTPSPPPPTCRDSASFSFVFNVPSNEELGHVLQNYLTKERAYTPASGYLGHLRLSPGLRDARFTALRWFLMVIIPASFMIFPTLASNPLNETQAGRRLGLRYGTIFAAVNYLDRFISLNCHVVKQWEVWMMELASIACLSIASKLDEFFVLSLDDFQTEGVKHMYQPSTIQQMELAILKALDWRLLCITPYSYAEPLIYRHAALGARTVELLVRALLDAEFIDCSACAMAVSALRCSVEELAPLESDSYISVLENLMPATMQAEVVSCQKLMEERMTNALCSPTSPVTVIPVQRTEVLDSHHDIDTCFLFDSYES